MIPRPHAARRPAPRLVPSLVAAALALQVATAAHAQVTTGPSKNAVYAWDNAAFSGFVADVNATITKGKAHRVLEVDAMAYTVGGCTGDHVAVYPIVNDSAMNGHDLYLEPTTGGVFRSAAGAWWLDLDAAEAQSPGKFVDQPLKITLRANSASCPDGATFEGSLRARLVKK
jgi:hypothetical protein